jgi:hypothetical protein
MMTDLAGVAVIKCPRSLCADEAARLKAAWNFATAEPGRVLLLDPGFEVAFLPNASVANAAYSARFGDSA